MQETKSQAEILADKAIEWLETDNGGKFYFESEDQKLDLILGFAEMLKNGFEPGDIDDFESPFATIIVGDQTVMAEMFEKYGGQEVDEILDAIFEAAPHYDFDESSESTREDDSNSDDWHRELDADGGQID